MSDISNENRDRGKDYHLVTHDGDKDADTGVAAIIKSFMKNPMGAVQIIAFVGGMYGVYYAIQGEISDVRADGLHRYEQLAGKIDALIISDTDARQKIDTLYARGDVRYTNIIAKLSSHDVDIAKIVAALDFIVDQYKSGNNDRASPPIRPPRVSITPTPVVP